MRKLFERGQTVTVTEPHNQFNACTNTTYLVADVNRIQGLYHMILASKGKIVGAVPQTKLKAA